MSRQEQIKKRKDKLRQIIHDLNEIMDDGDWMAAIDVKTMLQYLTQASYRNYENKGAMSNGHDSDPRLEEAKQREIEKALKATEAKLYC